MRLPDPSPVLDKDRAPMGPEILSSTGAGVWRKAPMAFPDSSSVLHKFQSATSVQGCVFLCIAARFFARLCALLCLFPCRTCREEKFVYPSPRSPPPQKKYGGKITGTNDFYGAKFYTPPPPPQVKAGVLRSKVCFCISHYVFPYFKLFFRVIFHKKSDACFEKPPVLQNRGPPKTKLCTPLWFFNGAQNL